MSMEEFIQALESMDPTELALGAGLIGIIATLMLIGSVLWYFVSALGYRKMFMKAGEAGWKAFIPYYKNFIFFRMAWSTKVFWAFLVTMLVMEFVPGEQGLVVDLIKLVCAIVCLVLGFKLDIRVAKSFGKSTGWGVLLFFFPFVASLILGYGKAEYIGNTTTTIETAAIEQ